MLKEINTWTYLTYLSLWFEFHYCYTADIDGLQVGVKGCATRRMHSSKLGRSDLVKSIVKWAKLDIE